MWIQRASVSEVSFNFYDSEYPFELILKKTLITSKWPFPISPYCPRALFMTKLKSNEDQTTFNVVVTVDSINIIVVKFQLNEGIWME